MYFNKQDQSYFDPKDRWVKIVSNVFNTIATKFIMSTKNFAITLNSLISVESFSFFEKNFPTPT